MREGFSKQNESDDILTLKKYILSLPLLGLISSIGILCIQFLIDKPWSIYSLLLNVIPLIFMLILFCVITFFCKKKVSCIDLTKKRIVLYTILFVLIAFLNIGLYRVKNVDILKYSFDTVYQHIEESDNRVYVVFGSKTCLYCENMQEIYKSAFLENKINSYYYVDLLYEGQNDDLIKKQNVSEIPLLVIYHNGEEEKRLVGTAVEDVIL